MGEHGEAGGAPEGSLWCRGGVRGQRREAKAGGRGAEGDGDRSSGGGPYLLSVRGEGGLHVTPGGCGRSGGHQAWKLDVRNRWRSHSACRSSPFDLLGLNDSKT